MPRVKKKAVKKSQYGSNMAAGAKKLKKGGKSKKNWIQGVNKSIKKEEPKVSVLLLLRKAVPVELKLLRRHLKRWLRNVRRNSNGSQKSKSNS